ncbi:hypothetical protein AAEX63_08035 [Luteococcus sp. H138]|uniref:hypothetical protein n=1 Tax=unclassified Luteococcus TaxID=2639923 RepID=UPI00313D37B0
MAVITLASATGSPGVTTTALGLALNWPRDVLLADCDRDPAQSIPAGWLRGTDLGGRGLGQLAAIHREHRQLSEEMWLQTVRLHDGERDRRYLPGFTHPGAVGLFAPIWQELADSFVAQGSGGTDVLVDAGRVGRDGLPAALVAASDVLLVVTGSSLRALAALRLHLPTVQAHAEALAAHCQLGLLVVGPSRPYGSSEIQKQFGLPVRHTIAWDAKQARVFSDGAAPPRGLTTGMLTRSYKACASRLSESVQRRSEVVAGTRSSVDWGAR